MVLLLIDMLLRPDYQANEGVWSIKLKPRVGSTLITLFGAIIFLHFPDLVPKKEEFSNLDILCQTYDRPFQLKLAIFVGRHIRLHSFSIQLKRMVIGIPGAMQIITQLSVLARKNLLQ